MTKKRSPLFIVLLLCLQFTAVSAFVQSGQFRCEPAENYTHSFKIPPHTTIKSKFCSYSNAIDQPYLENSKIISSHNIKYHFISLNEGHKQCNNHSTRIITYFISRNKTGNQPLSAQHYNIINDLFYNTISISDSNIPTTIISVGFQSKNELILISRKLE